MYLSVNSTHVASSYDFLLDLGTVPIACYFLFSILFIHVQYTSIFHENTDRDTGSLKYTQGVISYHHVLSCEPAIQTW